MRKIDSVIQKKISTLGLSENISAIVFVKSFYYALQYFYQNKISVTEKYSFINALCIESDAHTIYRLSKKGFVTYISSNASAKTLVDISKKVVDLGIDYTGNGVTIAYIDTGINPHLDFVFNSNRWIGNNEYNFNYIHCSRKKNVFIPRKICKKNT